MVLKNSKYSDFAEMLKREGEKIIIYGAGMIGQVVVPSILEQYGLENKVLFFVDRDVRKVGQRIKVGNVDYDIKSPDVLYEMKENIKILVTNSNFHPILEFLDSVSALEKTEVFLLPVMQLSELQKGESKSIKRMSKQPLIPKKIHYCWFSGNPIPNSLQKCMDSWREKCPDYEIICWNEKNYDVNKRRYTAEAYANQKYGFVSDVARWDILYEHGGIYLDTDVELCQTLDELLYQEAFVGTEKWGNINSGGGCGAIAHHPMIKKLLEERDDVVFVNEDGSFNLDTNGIYETKVFLEKGYTVNNKTQIINNVTVYSPQVFHPYDYVSCERNDIQDTISVHYFSGTWMDEKTIKNRVKTQEKYMEVLRRIELKENL